MFCKAALPAPLVVLPWEASSEASFHVELAAYLVVSDPWGASPWEDNVACLGVPSERQQQSRKISMKPTTCTPTEALVTKQCSTLN